MVAYFIKLYRFEILVLKFLVYLVCWVKSYTKNMYIYYELHVAFCMDDKFSINLTNKQTA